jgi:regulatory protein
MEGTDMSGPDPLAFRMRKIEYKAALRKAAAFCSRQEQCSGDIRRKLEQWKMEREDVEKILEQLRNENFLDDGRYAKTFVRDKFRFNRWGKVKIRHMLRQKEVSEEHAGLALSEIDPEEYLDACFELAGQKAASLKDEDPFKRRGKLFRYLSGRGFEPEVIGRALENLGEV